MRSNAGALTGLMLQEAIATRALADTFHINAMTQVVQPSCPQYAFAGPVRTYAPDATPAPVFTL
jgi:hypothetical protein